MKKEWKKKKEEFMTYMMTIFKNRTPMDNFDMSEIMQTFGTIFMVNASYESNEAVIDLRNLMAKQNIMNHASNIGKFAEMVSPTVEGGEGNEVTMIFDVPKDAEAVRIKVVDIDNSGNSGYIIKEISDRERTLKKAYFNWKGEALSLSGDDIMLKKGLFTAEIIPHHDTKCKRPIKVKNEKGEMVDMVVKPHFVSKITAIYNNSGGDLSVASGRAMVPINGIVAVSDAVSHIINEDDEVKKQEGDKAYKAQSGKDDKQSKGDDKARAKEKVSKSQPQQAGREIMEEEIAPMIDEGEVEAQAQEEAMAA